MRSPIRFIPVGMLASSMPLSSHQERGRSKPRSAARGRQPRLGPPGPDRVFARAGHRFPTIDEPWRPPIRIDATIPIPRNQNRDLFVYDTQAPLDIPELGRSREDGQAAAGLTFADPNAGRVPAFVVLPDSAGPFLADRRGGAGSFPTLGDDASPRTAAW